MSQFANCQLVAVNLPFAGKCTLACFIRLPPKSGVSGSGRLKVWFPTAVVHTAAQKRRQYVTANRVGCEWCYSLASAPKRAHHATQS